MSFESYIDRVLSHEGGYVNDPRDPGGETKWGISKRSYPSLDIKSLTREDAKTIYRRDFWDVLGDMPDALKFQMLDAAVNHGMTAAFRFMQQAVDVADDGAWGPLSKAALLRYIERFGISDVLIRFLAYRLIFFTKLAKFDVFGRGWSARIAGNLLYAAKDN